MTRIMVIVWTSAGPVRAVGRHGRQAPCARRRGDVPEPDDRGRHARLQRLPGYGRRQAEGHRKGQAGQDPTSSTGPPACSESRGGEVLDFPESPMLLGMEHYVAVVDRIRDLPAPNVVLCPHPVEVGPAGPHGRRAVRRRLRRLRPSRRLSVAARAHHRAPRLHVLLPRLQRRPANGHGAPPAGRGGGHLGRDRPEEGGDGRVRGHAGQGRRELRGGRPTACWSTSTATPGT